MTKTLYFRRVRPVPSSVRPSVLLGETTKSLPLSEVLRDILIPHYWPDGVAVAINSAIESAQDFSERGYEQRNDAEGFTPGVRNIELPEITLRSDTDKTYLKGLCDGGTPGACLLLGLIQADGGVVIWIGE